MGADLLLSCLPSPPLPPPPSPSLLTQISLSFNNFYEYENTQILWMGFNRNPRQDFFCSLKWNSSPGMREQLTQLSLSSPLGWECYAIGTSILSIEIKRTFEELKSELHLFCSEAASGGLHLKGQSHSLRTNWECSKKIGLRCLTSAHD